jgi:RND family efflux transporter MFP subunit
MTLWRQAVVAVLIAALAVAGWAYLSPGARPVIESVGLAAPFERLGLLPSAASGGGQGAEAGVYPAKAPGRSAVKVIAEEIMRRGMTTRISAIGTARGVRSVSVTTETAGRIVAVSVAPGDYVEAGTPIAELDSEQALLALDRARLLEADARRGLERLERLRTTGSATDLAFQEAELALGSAVLDRREAELALDRHRIGAPISGWVGLLAVEQGDLVASGAEITSVEDRSTLIVDFRVPERVANLLAPGMAVKAAAIASPGQTIAGTVSAIDNRIDEKSRTLKLQARLPNEGDRLRPGMAISLALDTVGGSYPSVDPLAIQWNSGGAFVWVLRDGKAARVSVRILQRNAGDVLVEADFQPGDLAVTEGVMALRPGIEAERVERPADG